MGGLGARRLAAGPQHVRGPAVGAGSPRDARARARRSAAPHPADDVRRAGRGRREPPRAGAPSRQGDDPRRGAHRRRRPDHDARRRRVRSRPPLEGGGRADAGAAPRERRSPSCSPSSRVSRGVRAALQDALAVGCRYRSRRPVAADVASSRFRASTIARRPAKATWSPSPTPSRRWPSRCCLRRLPAAPSRGRSSCSSTASTPCRSRAGRSHAEVRAGHNGYTSQSRHHLRPRRRAAAMSHQSMVVFG